MKLKHSSVLVVFFWFLIAACNQKPKELRFSNFIIANTQYPIAGDSSRSCTFEANIPIFEDGNQQLIDSINTFIAKTFFEKQGKVTDLKQLVKAESDSFYQIYLRDFSEFNQADFPLTYQYDLKIQVVFHNDKYITIKNENYDYMGGAHGNYSTLYYVFNTKDGSKVQISDIQADTVLLVNTAKQLFYNKKALNTNVPINEQGFWFEKNEFKLNDNFGLLNDTLVFVFNPYEISSYAEGQTELKIPLKKLN